MPKSKSENEPEVFEQHVDASGRIRLDRKLTPQEAAEQDAANVEAFVAARASRFGPTSDIGPAAAA